MPESNKVSKTCGCVDKRGLPILLVRYAIAPENAKAPLSGGSFHVNDSDGCTIKLEGKVAYTQRILRSGYLYVFDETRKKWQGYFVTAKGYYIPFAINSTGPQGPAAPANVDIKSCQVAGHAIANNLITISSPKQAGNVWFGFSDVEWTTAVWKRHQDCAYRQRHMRLFDVKKWMDTASHRHAVGVHHIADHVAEYNANSNKKAFSYSATTFQVLNKNTQNVIKSCENLLAGKGAVVALGDPVGITMELAALMSVQLTEFADNVKFKHPLGISSRV